MLAVWCTGEGLIGLNEATEQPSADAVTGGKLQALFVWLEWKADPV